MASLQRFFASLHHRRLAGGTIILASTQFIASIMGFIRDRSFATTFTDHVVTDVYFAAFRPSDFLFQTLIVSALGTVLVPMLAHARTQKDHREMDDLLSAILLVSGLAFAVIALLAAILLPWIAPYLVAFQGPQLELYIHFGRLALLSNCCFVFSNTLGQYLVNLQRYVAYGLTPILYTAGTIVGILLLTPILGPYGPIVGTLAGAIIHLSVRLTAVLWGGAHIRLVRWHSGIGEMLWLMLPRIISFGSIQGQLLVGDRVASELGAGAISINAYARNMESVLVGVVGIAVAQAVYAPLSEAVAGKNMARFHSLLRWSVGALLLTTVPGSILVALLGGIVGRVLGIPDHSLALFVFCLSLYCIAIPFDSLNYVLSRAFYAQKKTLLPSLVLCLGCLVMIATTLFTVGRLGVGSVAAGYAVGNVVLCTLLGALVLRFTRAKPNPA